LSRECKICVERSNIYLWMKSMMSLEHMEGEAE
jgi:hypothetical protein